MNFINNLVIKLLLIGFLISYISSINIYAQKITTGSGDWTDAIWSPAGVPSAGDQVEIRHVVRIDAGTGNVAGINSILITNTQTASAILIVDEGASLTVTGDVNLTAITAPFHTGFNIIGTGSSVTVDGDFNGLYQNTTTNGALGYSGRLYVNNSSNLTVNNLNYNKDETPTGGEDYSEIRVGQTIGSTASITVINDIDLDYSPTDPGPLSVIIENDGVIMANNLTMESTSSDAVATAVDLQFQIFNNGKLDIDNGTILTYNAYNQNHEVKIFLEDNGAFETNDLTLDSKVSSTGNLNIYLDAIGSSTITVLGDVVVTNVDKSDCRIDMRETSTLTLGGTISISGATNKSFVFKFDAAASTNSTLVLNGSVTQTFPDPRNDTYQNVILNNSSGTTTKLTGDSEINGALTLTQGILDPDGFDLIIMDDATATSDVDSFVDGSIQKIGDDAFIFPTGDGTTWARIGMTAPSSATDAYTAQYFTSGHGNTDVFSPLNNVSTLEYWSLDRTVGTSDVSVTLYWENDGNSIIDDNSSTDLVVARYDVADDWTSEGQGAIMSSGITGNVSSAAITDWDASNPYFTFGSLSKTNNPLPVTLIDFRAKLINNKVELHWSTASEINNDYFIIERSPDGINFESLEQQDGAGNSIRELNYVFIDHLPLSPIAYYRLKQVDFDGKSTYSNIVNVERLMASRNNMTLYPNPVKKTDTDFSILLPENVTASDVQSISLVNTNGKEVTGIKFESMMNKINIEIPSHIHYNPGLYLFKIATIQKVYISKLVVE